MKILSILALFLSIESGFANDCREEGNCYDYLIDTYNRGSAFYDGIDLRMVRMWGIHSEFPGLGLKRPTPERPSLPPYDTAIRCELRSSGRFGPLLGDELHVYCNMDDPTAVIPETTKKLVSEDGCMDIKLYEADKVCLKISNDYSDYNEYLIYVGIDTDAAEPVITTVGYFF